jgi:hypothetical protein
VKNFILFDGRALSGDTDDAAVLEVVETEEQARQAGATSWKGYYAVWYEYDVDGKKLINERMRPDLPPCLPPEE